MINEHNIKNSFRAIKGDMLRMQGELLNIRQQQEIVLIELEKLTNKPKKVSKKKPVKKNTSKKRK